MITIIKGALFSLRWLVFVGIAASLSCKLGQATTYTAASCNESDVMTAIAAEQASPADGDVISIPAGTCTWTGTTGITRTFANSVTIQGAGAISSTAGGASTTGTDQTAITDGITSNAADLSITTTSGKSFRLTGIAIAQNGTSGSRASVGVYGKSASVRIDHNHFTVVSAGLYIGDTVLGVADHDYFSSASSSLTNDFQIHNGNGWNGGSLSDNADGSWADTEHWGSSEFFYIEDTRFYNGDTSDAHDGARYVIRYCTMTGDGSSGQQIYDHGLTDARGRATRAAEIYMNTFTEAGNQSNPPYSLNSGTLLFWGNSVTGGYQNAVLMGYDCRPNSNGCSYSYSATPNGWGHCGTFQGPSNWDQNSNSSGYACMDQPGRGKGDLLNGQAFPNALDSVTSTITWPNQALSPIYVWDNVYTPEYYTSSPIVSTDPTGATVTTNNVDYYMQFGTLANPGTFNGTAGVGQGTLLPTNPSAYTNAPNCTPNGTTGVGPGYWDTTNQTLYVCTATNTWTVHYTPYTYPNPLTQDPDPPAAPTNASAAGH